MSAIFNKIIAFFLSILAFFGLYKPPVENLNYKVYSNVSYGEKAAEKMDMYIPNSIKEGDELCAFIYVHGGSWQYGDKSEGKDYCSYISKNGIPAVTMNYSLYSEKNKVSAFDMLDEITMCINELKRLTEENGCKLSKIALMGSSAGAHLTSLYAYSRYEECPVPIAFIAEMSGPFDFHEETWEGTSYTGSIADVTSMLAGTKITEDNREDVINSVSPLYFVDKDSVPTLLAYGEKDELVPCRSSKLLLSKLTAAGVTCDAVAFPNSGHSLGADSDCSKEFANRVIDYINTYFNASVEKL